MSPVLTYTLFICLGSIIGAGIILIIGYKLSKKKPSARDMLAKALDQFFVNQQRNTLADLRRLNPERCKAFGHAVNEMHVTFWATAIAGETGELCNLVKKMARGDQGNFKDPIAKEAADVLIYLDLLCTHLDINLEAATISKFNEVSDRVNSPLKLK